MIENFVVATIVAFSKYKRKLTHDQANFDYPKIKLTEALLHCTVCITCVQNKIKFHYKCNSGCLQLSMTISQFVMVLLNRHQRFCNGYISVCIEYYQVSAIKEIESGCLSLSVTLSKVLRYSHGYTGCYNSEHALHAPFLLYDYITFSLPSGRVCLLVL